MGRSPQRNVGLGGQRSARKLSLVAAVFFGSDLPLGITPGIYTQVELLQIKTTPLFGRSRQATQAGLVKERRKTVFLMAVLSVFVLVALVGSLPIWPHSKKWGFGPISGVSVIILVVLILFWTGHL